jgi:2-dehydropantoate 2-reductase
MQDVSGDRRRTDRETMAAMNTLIVGAGALGGLIAARMLAAGVEVWLAARDPTRLRQGLRVRGVGGEIRVVPPRVDVLEAFDAVRIDVLVLATKAPEAIAIAPRLRGLVVPIQNGGVSAILGKTLGEERVIGALSNLGATMHAPGDYEQRNAGHLLIDADAPSSAAVAGHLARGVSVRTTRNFRGAVWSKLLLNCSVTSIGAIAGETMRAYLTRPTGRALFARAYAEALEVALASGAAPERMLVEPIPPPSYEPWLESVVAAYGDLEPSMLQDFRRGRRTEIDFITGYVCAEGRRLGVATPANDAIVATVHAIERGEIRPSPANLEA